MNSKPPPRPPTRQVVTCPHCGARNNGSSALTGRRVGCGNCGEAFVWLPVRSRNSDNAAAAAVGMGAIGGMVAGLPGALLGAVIGAIVGSTADG